jgi:hypothetical protein
MHTIAKVRAPSVSRRHTAARTETLDAVLVPDTVWVDEPVFLFYRTHTGNYMHALVDDYLGALRLTHPPLRSYAHNHMRSRHGRGIQPGGCVPMAV